jgi:cyclophilin family peptidyl-prolyl cis-trans isomerase/HEAT repeat protein
MKKLILLVILFTTVTYSQQSQEVERLKKQRDNLELVMRFQDLRTIHDGKLISILSDTDDVVRERATFAFGSIQDTAVIPLLMRNLSDPVDAVQLAAAFAIGQSATLLSPKGKINLESELIWKKLGYTKVDERLIEEIGKFGTEDALSQLMIKYGTLFPRVYTNGLMMSIARFAIRGIYNKEAIQYLTTFTKHQSAANWRAMYALMRISTISKSHTEIMYEINNISQLYKDGNPLTRMHLATLLGRLKSEEYCLDPLMRMAGFDHDWRVRVNAIKALSDFDLKGKDNVIKTFKRAFYDDNIHIALTALSSFGNVDLNDQDSSAITKETLGWLKRMVENPDRAYKWQYQGQASITYAKLVGEEAVDLLLSEKDLSPQLQANIIEALAQTGSTKVISELFNYLESDNPIIVKATLEGLQTLISKNKQDKQLIDRFYLALIKALDSYDVAVISSATSILIDSLFLRTSSVEMLITALTGLRMPDDNEAMQEIINTLGKLKDDRAVDVLRKQLQQPYRILALAAASALESITGKNYLKEIANHLQPQYVDLDFKYLRSLPKNPTVTIVLYPGKAPFTVMNFLKLAEKGFYHGMVFHRIVPNFVIQGGDPRGDGWGGPGYSIRSEFSDFTFDENYVGMASSGKDTEGSQFFITQSPQPHLDGRYTIFGKVISGMDKVFRMQSDDRIFDIKPN